MVVLHIFPNCAKSLQYFAMYLIFLLVLDTYKVLNPIFPKYVYNLSMIAIG